MRTWILGAFLILAGHLVQAQCTSRQIAGVTITPANFGPYDQITIDFDAAGGPMDGATEVFIWAWCAAGDAPSNNGGWTNPRTDASKLENVGPNRWRFRMTPRTFYATPNLGATINFLFRSRNGAPQTGDGSFCIQLPVFNEAVTRVFPLNITQEDAVTLYFNQNLLPAGDPLRTATAPAIYVQATLDNGDVLEAATVVETGTNTRYRMRSLGNGTFAATFVPSAWITVPSGRRINDLLFRVVNSANTTQLIGAGSFRTYVDGN